MKRMTVEEFAGKVDELSNMENQEQILLTRRGKPLALVRSVRGLVEDEINEIADPAFWKMIAERRREPTVPFAVVEAKLREDERGERIKRKTTEKRGR